MISPIHSDLLQWQAIETAPDLCRVWVLGWQPRHGTTQGYWWWQEDAVCDGKACEHPSALFWAPIVLPEPLPPRDTGAAA